MFDRFSKEKSDFLSKKDKSKKGSIDKDILPLVNKINSKKDFYTTSSCSGRIMLIERLSNKKNECKWLLAEHRKIKPEDIINILKNKNIKNEIWLKFEPLILHVACNNIESAKKFLETARKLFKRSGIISITESKVMIEAIGTERIEAIVAGKDFVAGNSYIKNLVKSANKKFEENKSRLSGLSTIIT